jgi:hypothetical protein
LSGSRSSPAADDDTYAMTETTAQRQPVRRRALSRPRLVPWSAAAGAALALAGDVAFDPSHRHVPLCPFRAVTGWWCPLCGGLRCADALVHGDFLVAVHDNLPLVAALPLLAWAWVDWVARARAGEPARRMSVGGVIAIVATLAVFTAVRNMQAAAVLQPG